MKLIRTGSLLIAAGSIASAQSFNIDIGSLGAISGLGAPTNAYGGAAGQAGEWHWLDADPIVGLDDYTSPTLTDISGAATGVTMQFTVANLGQDQFTELDFDEASAVGDDATLMEDILYCIGGPYSVTFHGLASGTYDVYTYAMAPDSSAFFTGIDVPAGSGGYQAVGGDFSSGHAQGVTYAMHTVAVDGSGMLVIDISEDVTDDSLNGFQLVFGGGGGIGTNYCGPANPHSGGIGGVISATGSTAVADNNVTLIASDLPAGQFGMFVNSMTQGFITPPGSSGNLCVVGQIGRHNANIMNSGPGGTFSLALDLNSVPTPLGPVAINPGETWNFQTWFRDLGGTSNFTDAIEIPFN